MSWGPQRLIRSLQNQRASISGSFVVISNSGYYISTAFSLHCNCHHEILCGKTLDFDLSTFVGEISQTHQVCANNVKLFRQLYTLLNG